MADSLVIGEQIELWGSNTGPVPSANPLCAGATFWLQTGFDLSAPVPTTDIVGSLLLDGERPFGYRASNRTITLPIEIGAPDFATLSAAREVLLNEINQQTWTLRWTRDVTGPLAGNTTVMPLLFDCFRAKSSVWQYGGIDTLGRQPIGLMTITFDALPYGRSDVPVVVDFPSPLAGAMAPPAALTVDPYTTLPGNFLSGQNTNFEGGIGGWLALAGCGVTSSTAQAHTGAGSIALTATGTANMVASSPVGSGGLPVVPGQQVFVSAWFRANTLARSCAVGVRWYDSNGTFLSSSTTLGTNDSNAAWTGPKTLGAAGPASAAYAVPFVQVASPAGAGEIHYVDDVSIGYYWSQATVGPTGSSAEWDPSVGGVPAGTGVPAVYTSQGIGPVNIAAGWTLQPVTPGILFTNIMTVLASAVQTAGGVQLVTPGQEFVLAQNWLNTAGSGSVHNGDMEGTIGSWVLAVNCAVADSALQAHSGTDSMSMTSAAAGDMTAGHTAAANYATNGLAVIPGQQVYCSAWFRASAATPRSCQVQAEFYDVAGNSLSVVTGTTVTDGNAGWVQSTDGGVIVAPASAAWCRARVRVQATGGISEVHFADDVTIAVAAPQIYTITAITSPFGSQQNVTYSPNSPATALTGDLAIQCGPSPVRSALTFYAGFGSTSYYKNWAVLGGRVTFAVKLTDISGTILSFSSTVKCAGSSHSAAPTWQRIRVPIPSRAGFNFSAVTGYQITVTNRSTGDMRYSQVYLDSLQAAAPPAGLVAPTRGFVYDLAGVQGSARAPVSLTLQNTAAPANTTKTYANPGGFSWTCPTGVTTVAVRCFGRGGAGSTVTSVGGGGGSGGSTAFNAAVAVTAGVTYSGFIGAGALPGDATTPPTTFTGDSVTVSAPSGISAAANSVTGAAAPAAGTGGFAGGAGGLGDTGVSAAGGGSSAGSAAGGNIGAAGSAGGAGGAAVTGGGAGGHGHPSGGSSSSNGTGPGGGGGGGCEFGGHIKTGGNGADGAVTLTYLAPVAMSSAIVHRPPVTAPAMLSPFVSPSIEDIPAGTITYPLQTLIFGIPARFAGTYNVIAVPFSWDTPASARTITVTVNEHEQAGGVNYAASASASITPNSLPQLPGVPAGTGFADLGFLTLPVNELPQDNVNAYYNVTITSTDTADRFMDILFLDTQGSTVIIQSPTGYQNFYLDEPIADRDIGLILGTLFDRDDAVSVLDRANITGVPVSVDPNAANTSLLVYSMEGAPGLQMSYFPRWFYDRYM